MKNIGTPSVFCLLTRQYECTLEGDGYFKTTGSIFNIETSYISMPSGYLSLSQETS